MKSLYRIIGFYIEFKELDEIIMLEVVINIVIGKGDVSWWNSVFKFLWL